MRKENVMGRGFDLALVIITAIILFAFGTAIFFLPKAEFSERENRPLADLEPPSLRDIADGSFFGRVSEFYSDRFPLRGGFVAVKAATELIFGRGENNGVIFGKDGYLIPRGDYESFDVAERNFALFSRIEDIAEAEKKEFFCAFAPRSIDVMRGALPSYYRGNEERIWALAGRCMEHIDLRAELRREATEGAGVWYKTDHHWSTEGAYIAYLTLSESMGFTPYPREFFQIETVSEEFFGTSHSRAGGAFGAADRVELFRYAGDESVSVRVAESGESYQGFYRMDRLEAKDKYSVFLGGNYSRVTVTEEESDGRERLLLIKDSYANSLLPFLALHYDIEVIDLRYFNGDLRPLIADADAVLLLHGIDTVATTGLVG